MASTNLDLELSELPASHEHPAPVERPSLGVPGRLAIFGWTLALVAVAPSQAAALAAALALTVNALLWPRALRRLLNPRWLLLLILLVAPGLIWLGPRDAELLGLPYSTAGLAAGLRMALRATAVLVAVDALARSVGITQVAGLADRAGLPGLGFALGVAVNLLPALRRSSRHAWHALQMRGGLRRSWWRGLRLLLVTVIANALRRADEIALAAEARAFRPGHSRPPPLVRGHLDSAVAAVLLCSLASVLLLRVL